MNCVRQAGTRTTRLMTRRSRRKSSPPSLNGKESMGRILEERRADNDARLQQLQQELTTAARIAEGKACVYVTGSFGREEASRHSDLDLFIVGRYREDAEGRERRVLRNLDEILLK